MRRIVMAAVPAALLVTLCVPVRMSAATTNVPQLSIFAGRVGKSGTPRPGRADRTPLGEVRAVAVSPDGTVYISDGGPNDGRPHGARLLSVSPNGHLSIVAGINTRGRPKPGPAIKSPLRGPDALAADARGNVYLADYDRVLKIGRGGRLSIIAGSGAHGAPRPGPARKSPLNMLNGIAVDRAGNVFVCELGSSFGGVSEILRITPRGRLSVVGGNGTTGRPRVGLATKSPLGDLTGLAVTASGALLVADGGEDGVNYNGVVEKISPNGHLSIIAGKIGSSGVPRPGRATSSPLHYPNGVAVDARGDIYIADGDLAYGGNCAIEKVNPRGVLSVITGKPGNCSTTPRPGRASASAINPPADVAIDNHGHLFIADTYNAVVEEVSGV